MLCSDREVRIRSGVLQLNLGAAYLLIAAVGSGIMADLGRIPEKAIFGI